MSNVLSPPVAAGPNAPAAKNPVAAQDPASMWPVLVLVAVFLVAALAGALAQRQAAQADTLPLPASPAKVYAGLLLMEWGLALYVWRAGLRRRPGSLREMIGGRWRGLRDVAVDGGIALAAWAGWSVVARLWEAWSGPDPAASTLSLLPHRPHEVVLWILLSLSAGFSEELVFRGYLQSRFRTLTGSAALAVILQAALFGVSHGYQGVQSCLRITVYGLLFGGLAAWRRSLRPGMLAHAWTDVAAGLLRI
jgi:membrane protease YdiL (CAAX protease family)